MAQALAAALRAATAEMGNISGEPELGIPEVTDVVSLDAPTPAEVRQEPEPEDTDESFTPLEDLDDVGMEDFFSAYSDNHMDMRSTSGPGSFYTSAWSSGFFSSSMLTDLRTASSFSPAEAGSLDEAVMKARELVQSVGTLNSGHGNVPIRPLGVPEKKAATVAQAMIERMSTIEDDETRMQDEFKYDTKRLMKLKLNPMRGISSAKVGRSKAPIAIFIDYSGSCSHVSDLFGLILVGFANEGATVLIGGNGVVNAVYHPFPNRPLDHYAQDMTQICRMDVNEAARVRAGYIVRCQGSNLQDLTVGPMIACTDFDSYQALMARKRKTTHIILALEREHSRNLRSSMRQGLVDTGGRSVADWWTKHATDRQRSTNSGIYNQAQNLALHQIVYPVHDLVTLTDMLRSSR